MCVKKLFGLTFLYSNSTYTTDPVVQGPAFSYDLVSKMVFLVTTTSVVIKFYGRIGNGLYQRPDENTRGSIHNRTYVPTIQPGWRTISKMCNTTNN